MSTLAKSWLLGPTALVTAITLIEKYLPGWWYYIAQTPRDVYFHTGPGRNCPYIEDVALAKTLEGDNGYGGSFMVNPLDPDIAFTGWIKMQTDRLAMHRYFPEVDRVEAVYRHQSSQGLACLTNSYLKLLEDMPVLEAAGYDVTTIHLGSCDHSADCSLRGTKDNGGEFDISIDIEDRDWSIGDSLACALTELKNDILTNKGSCK